jgi:phenylacetate-CoA ligase
MEDHYLAEIINPATGIETGEGGEGELVLTTLHRKACPLLRYRTGDLVRKRTIDGHLHLEGGILGRADDMMVIRGVNLYPSALENIIRSFPEIDEFRVILQQQHGMDECQVEIETLSNTPPDIGERLESRLKDTFLLRIPVRQLPPDSLPRHEFKSRRWIRQEPA